ncbi:MAG: epoxyqueuosine reductase QueH [Candidatus Cloacimonadota bacterium]|nr:epoxyqueuosine reductase QueH [Candidatus Cloacimonadota bacterium]
MLVHICCAPCFIAPYKHLKENKDFEIYGFWFNPNIHPYTEYHKRKTAVFNFARENNIRMIWKDDYNLEDFLQKSAYREDNRCQHCYYDRLNYAAIIAKKGNFDFFTSSLLYSKYQKHKLIKSIGEEVSKKNEVKFYYQDFREYWKEGIKLSKGDGMYRQQYCGCIYSEKDRYQNQLQKQWKNVLAKNS